jgi:hypothetical protein
MKKLFFFLAAFAAAVTASSAQGVRLNLYGAYVFDDEVSNYYDAYNYFYGSVQGGAQYGAGLEFTPRENSGFEILWLSQSTTAPVRYNSNYLFEKSGNLDVSLNTVMLGFNHYARTSELVEGFAGVSFGCMFISAKDQNSGASRSKEKFAWGVHAGANIWASDKIAIKIQGQLLSAVQAVGGSLYFGTGGSGAGVSTYSSMLQFGIGGGLTYNLKGGAGK